MSTIFALSTAPGRAGVAIIRISGEDAFAALDRLGVSRPEPRQARLVSLRDGERVIDQALILRFDSPYSYTGEDMVELHIHGSSIVIKKLFNLLSGMDNYSMAEPGEFSRRAFQNGKLDLTEVEGIVDLIHAETEAQHSLALRAMQGNTGDYYMQCRETLMRSLAHLEAYIDFPDEEIPSGVKDSINNNIQELIDSIKHQLADNNVAERVREGIEIAIVGAPNAGKSSLLNLLAQRDAAIVSTQAGTTRDLIEVNMDIKGFPVTLIDTAGVRESDNEIEKEGIRRALERAEKADMILLIIDATQPIITHKLKQIKDSNILYLLNKIDQVDFDPDVELDAEMLSISVKENKNIDKLLDNLAHNIEEHFAHYSGAMITHTRHRKAMENALGHLERYKQNDEVEIICEELRLAVKEIASVTGYIGVEDILDIVFHSFCIGK